jgi:calcineurin-like phosphoesterase family protein
MRYFTSDPHYYHKNVIRYCNRPFTRNVDKLTELTGGFAPAFELNLAIERDVVEMNGALIANWNSIVTPEDEVVVVGDFSMALRPVELYTNRLNGRKILVAGNHDFCHPAHKKSKNPENQKKWTDKYLYWGWSEVHLKMELDLPGIGLVNVSHMPYKGGSDSGDEERHEKHRLDDDGKILIHGHIHEKGLITRSRKGTLQLNVGVDVWGMKPVSEEEVIRAILNAKRN